MSITEKVHLIGKHRDKFLEIKFWNDGGFFGGGDSWTQVKWKGIVVFKQARDDVGMPFTHVDRRNKECYDYIEKLYRPKKNSLNDSIKRDREANFSPLTDKEIEARNPNIRNVKPKEDKQ